MPRKNQHQRGTLRIMQSDEGAIWYAVNVHSGRVTVPVNGPGTNNVEMSKELFRATVRGIR